MAKANIWEKRRVSLLYEKEKKQMFVEQNRLLIIVRLTTSTRKRSSHRGEIILTDLEH